MRHHAEPPVCICAVELDQGAATQDQFHMPYWPPIPAAVLAANVTCTAVTIQVTC